MAVTKKKVQGTPTIDVELVVVKTAELEIAVDTASKIGVEPQTETTEAIKLMKLGRLLAQKPASTTITGHTITLTDNVFVPELVKILQGGTIKTGTDGEITGYAPPAAGSTDKGEIFILDVYSAVYDASGQIVKYEKISYPNCQGNPISMNSEDNVFRVSEYTINSAPQIGQEAWDMEYVDALPDFTGTETKAQIEAQQEQAATGRTYTTGGNQTGTEVMPTKSTDIEAY